MEYILLDFPFNLILIIAREWNDLPMNEKSDKAHVPWYVPWKKQELCHLENKTK